MSPSQIDNLNRAFGIPGAVAAMAGNGGLPMLRVTAPSASADVYLHGMQITSWRPAGAGEVLFLSEHSAWQDGRAIRGGIPICFPWFRGKALDPAAPAHGFVRTKEWQLQSVTTHGDSVVLTGATEDDESTRRWWPWAFRLEYKLSIGAFLSLELKATNTGQAPFRFEEALHSYFRVSDAASVSVRGLDQVSFLDNMDGNRRRIQSGDLVFRAQTDNAYVDVAGSAELIDPAWRRAIVTEKVSSRTTVVWNPWQEGAATLKDLGNDEWRQFACVEASNILGSAISLAPGEQHAIQATLRVLALDA